MKNYLDSGKITNEMIIEDRVLQWIEFFDKSYFKGEMIVDEESKLLYKEGLGKLYRPTNGTNFAFYNCITGSWSRGMLHTRRAEL